MWGYGKRQDQVSDLKAKTYNLEGEQVVQSQLDTNDIFRDSISKANINIKFTLPAIKEGSIIEYSYTITSHYLGNLPAWHFQYFNYPCLYSQFEVAIPEMLGYVTFYHGIDSFSVNSSDKSKERYRMATLDVTANVKKHLWVMKNIAAFKNENYLYNPDEYVDKIEFQLAQYYDGRDVTNFANNWSAVNHELIERDDFIGAIDPDKTSYLMKTIEKITAKDDNLLQAAKSIYTYIRDNFLTEEEDDIYTYDDMFTINKKKKGTVAEINLLLTDMLRQKGINASPVILSTRGYAVNSPSYPEIKKFNYVVCMVKIFGDTIYLDASQPGIKFGRLYLNCYNGHARIVGDKDSGSVYFNPGSIKEQVSTTVFIVNDEQGKLSGSYQKSNGYFSSDEIRAYIKTAGRKKFFEELKTDMQSDIVISNEAIDSLENINYPVKVSCDVIIPHDSTSDIIYFDPFLDQGYSHNPFTPQNRKYPVEMPYPLDELYVLNMEIPNGYIIDELPKSVKAAYNQNEGFYEYIIQKSESNIQLRAHIKLNKATFAPDEYNTLRDFFSYIIKKQSEQIVFKKKK